MKKNDCFDWTLTSIEAIPQEFNHVNRNLSHCINLTCVMPRRSIAAVRFK